jgi:hypothetical protein
MSLIGGLDVGGIVRGSTTTGVSVVKWVAVFGILITILIMIWYWLQFNNTIILKHLVNDRVLVETSKYRDYIDDEGIPYIQTIRKVFDRRLHPIPPSNCIDVQSTGRKWVEGFVTETGEIHYIENKGIKNKEEARAEAFTTKQRTVLINQYRKAKLRKGFKFQEHLITIVGIVALVVIVVCLMALYGKIAEPLLDMADKVNANQDGYTKQLEILERIERNTQILTGDKHDKPPS